MDSHEVEHKDGPKTNLGSLTQNALQRLREMVRGNGLDPQSVRVRQSEEQTCEISGTLVMTPAPKISQKTYPGPARNTKAQVVTTQAQLRAVAGQPDPRATAGWFDAAIRELEQHPGKGWGADEYRITLPDYTRYFSLTESCVTCGGKKRRACPTCVGEGRITCRRCQGSRMQNCTQCLGQGVMPNNPQQPCTLCRGMRTQPCQECQGHGFLQCAACKGQGGVACRTCTGSGVVTTEVRQDFDISTNFQLGSGVDLPQRLRQMIGRVGAEGLARGHAEIRRGAVDNLDQGRIALNYVASVPYADATFHIGDVDYSASLIGKRAAIVNIAPFMERVLRPGLEALERAAKGMGDLRSVLRYRAISTMLEDVLAGNREYAAFRRQYPVGFSKAALESLYLDLRIALQRMTLRSRLFSAGLLMLAAAILSAAYFQYQVYDMWLRADSPWWVGALGDLGVLLALLLAVQSGAALASRISLRRALPDIERLPGGNAASPLLNLGLLLATLGGFATSFWVWPPVWADIVAGFFSQKIGF